MKQNPVCLAIACLLLTLSPFRLSLTLRSSRSHTIFRLVIESSASENFEGAKDDGDAAAATGAISGNAITVSHLNLVDLAGLSQ